MTSTLTPLQHVCHALLSLNKGGDDLFWRADIHCPTTDQCLNKLRLYIFAMKIALQAVHSLRERKLLVFDATVGDCKCQVRTSMILDMIEDLSSQTEVFEQEEEKLQAVIAKAERALTMTDLPHTDSGGRRQLRKELRNTYLSQFFERHQLNVTVLPEIRLASLCLFAALREMDMVMWSKRQSERFLNSAKGLLSRMSVDYERQVAHIYGSKEEQQALRQIETPGYRQMTAFFPSFKPILAKMKEKQQSFVIKIAAFCSCGGVQSETMQRFVPREGRFVLQPIMEPSDQVVMVIDCHQFSGSLATLREMLAVPPQRASCIPYNYYRPCTCQTPSSPSATGDIETAILAYFAQHPQFTTDAPIDFAGLQLSESRLKQEYEALKNLEGFGIGDMRRLFIHHIYPATLEEAALHYQVGQAQ